jgi:hypothetical protein
MPYWRSDNEMKSMALPGMKMRKTRVNRTKRDIEKEGGSAHGSECGTSFSTGMMAAAYHGAEVKLCWPKSSRPKMGPPFRSSPKPAKSTHPIR